MDKKAIFWKYIVYVLTALVMAICIMSWKNLLEAEGINVVLKILSDSFSLPGILFLGFAGLGWVSTKGGYDLFGYSWSSFKGFFVRDSYFKKPETYFDYVQRKNAERKPFNKAMFAVGLAFFAIGMVITVVYLVI